MFYNFVTLSITVNVGPPPHTHTDSSMQSRMTNESPANLGNHSVPGKPDPPGLSQF